MLKKYLITPGPTAVPEQVLLSMAAPMIHHRTPEFEHIFKLLLTSHSWANCMCITGMLMSEDRIKKI